MQQRTLMMGQTYRCEPSGKQRYAVYSSKNESADLFLRMIENLRFPSIQRWTLLHILKNIRDYDS
jgi:hypothetical protein